jgi:bacterioferritin (cytochrome b1)
MTPDDVIDILNELLDIESRSILPRLRASGVFVSWASADELADVTRMTDEDAEHREWLIEAILKIGGDPRPVSADIRSTAMHYLDLHYVLPQVLDDARNCLKSYETAAAQLGGNAVASEVVSKIITRHRRHVETLEKFTARVQASTA